MKYFIIFCLLLFSVSPSFSEVITDLDLKTLEFADFYSASYVTMKLIKIYKAEGENSLKPAIPAIINRVTKILEMDEYLKGDISEGEGEFLGDLLFLISVSGDLRVKETLLKAMISPYTGGNIIAKGFLKLGPQVIPEIIRNLDTENKKTIKNITLTLSNMAKYDSTGTFFSINENKKIMKILIKNIYDDDENVRSFSIKALGYFGDKSIISILEQIEINDPSKTDTGIFKVREVARISIEQINKRGK